MADSQTLPPTSGDTSTDEYETVQVSVSTCAEFLALNLSLTDNLPSLLSNGLSYNLTDTCGFPTVNATLVTEHPAKYAYYITHPIFLLMCTLGNILTIVVLTRERVHSVKWIFLISLAVSDMLYMWSQFFPYIDSVVKLGEDSSYHKFMLGFLGSCIFTQEMFITASDWILVGFSVERFIAVVFPVWYNVLSSSVSKTVRATVSISIIFLLAGLYSLFNLFDYYWFYYNDDKRCPPALIRPPDYISSWANVYQWAVVIIPVMTFATIITLNTIVTLKLILHREFRRTHAHQAKSLDCNNNNNSQNYQAIRMLLASAVIYSITQFFPFIYNILRIIQQYPNCGYYMDADLQAKFTRANSVLTNFNYSVNFVVYSLVSTNFRLVLMELFYGRIPTEKHVRWYHVLSKKRWDDQGNLHGLPLQSGSSMSSGEVANSVSSDKRGSVETILSHASSGDEAIISPTNSSMAGERN